VDETRRPRGLDAAAVVEVAEDVVVTRSAEDRMAEDIRTVGSVAVGRRRVGLHNLRTDGIAFAEDAAGTGTHDSNSLLLVAGNHFLVVDPNTWSKLVST